MIKESQLPSNSLILSVCVATVYIIIRIHISKYNFFKLFTNKTILNQAIVIRICLIINLRAQPLRYQIHIIILYIHIISRNRNPNGINLNQPRNYSERQPGNKCIRYSLLSCIQLDYADVFRSQIPPISKVLPVRKHKGNIGNFVYMKRMPSHESTLGSLTH